MENFEELWAKWNAEVNSSKPTSPATSTAPVVDWEIWLTPTSKQVPTHPVNSPAKPTTKVNQKNTKKPLPKAKSDTASAFKAFAIVLAICILICSTCLTVYMNKKANEAIEEANSIILSASLEANEIVESADEDASSKVAAANDQAKHILEDVQ